MGARRRLKVLAGVAISLWLAGALQAAPPSPLELKLDTTAITYEFSERTVADEALRLNAPELSTPKAAGLDNLLKKAFAVRGGLKGVGEGSPRQPASPSPSPLPIPDLRRLALGITSRLGLVPSASPPPLTDRAPRLPDDGILPRIAGSRVGSGDDAGFKLTTKLDPMARTYGEFTARDWSDLGRLSGSSRARPGPTRSGDPRQPEPREPDPGQRADAASPAPPTSEPESDRGRRRGGRESGMLILPSLDASGFQIGTGFSLSGRLGGRLGFSGQGALGAGLAQPRFGLESTYRTQDGLRLNATYERELPSASKAGKPDKRVWTGVDFNF